jgi:phosphohistidine swiveling domain-containing protein
MSTPPGQAIPAPATFPLRWERPSQARQLWTLDRQHFGRPLPPLAADVWCRQGLAGTNRAFEHYQLPIRLEMCAINGYLYNCYQPLALPPEAVLKILNMLGQFAPRLFQVVRRTVAAGMAAKYLPKITPIIGGLQAQWEHLWLPEIREHLTFWHSFNLRGSSEAELALHLSESLDRIERLWEIHFLVMVPAFLALSQFEDLHREYFETNLSGDTLTTYRLLHAADTSFMQADRALWRLSRQARTLPAVCTIFERAPAHEVVPTLESCTEGQIFLAELHAWLSKYGLRGSGGDGLSDRSWFEDLLPVLQHLQSLLQQADSDREAEVQVQAAECAAAVEQVRKRLLRERYEQALQAAQTASFLSTEHHFWIDQQAMFCLRRVFLEIGRRLVETGELDQPDDVLYLTGDEVRGCVARSPVADVRARVEARKAHLVQARVLNPPRFLGTMPLMAPPLEDPFVRAMTRVLGGDALGPTDRTTPRRPRELIGQAASPGVVRGPVRVLHGLNESGRLRRGDILVAEATMPAWTPLFAIAAGVVTDVGGILSHTAITAREYGIPAIVGTRDASVVLHDDQLVEVDGSSGTVRQIEDTT